MIYNTIDDIKELIRSIREGLITKFLEDLKNQPEGISEGDQYGPINYIIEIEEHKKLIEKWEAKKNGEI